MNVRLCCCCCCNERQGQRLQRLQSERERAANHFTRVPSCSLFPDLTALHASLMEFMSFFFSFRHRVHDAINGTRMPSLAACPVRRCLQTATWTGVNGKRRKQAAAAVTGFRATRGSGQSAMQSAGDRPNQGSSRVRNASEDPQNKAAAAVCCQSQARRAWAGEREKSGERRRVQRREGMEAKESDGGGRKMRAGEGERERTVAMQ